MPWVIPDEVIIEMAEIRGDDWKTNDVWALNLDYWINKAIEVSEIPPTSQSPIRMWIEKKGAHELEKTKQTESESEPPESSEWQPDFRDSDRSDDSPENPGGTDYPSSK